MALEIIDICYELKSTYKEIVTFNLLSDFIGIPRNGNSIGALILKGLFIATIVKWSNCSWYLI